MTPPKIFFWDSKEKIVEKILGKQLLYRKRVRQCQKCNYEFETLEFSKDDFRLIFKQTERSLGRCDESSRLPHAHILNFQNALRLQHLIEDVFAVRFGQHAPEGDLPNRVYASDEVFQTLVALYKLCHSMKPVGASAMVYYGLDFVSVDDHEMMLNNIIDYKKFLKMMRHPSRSKIFDAAYRALDTASSNNRDEKKIDNSK